jgi:hypothetical protein
MKIKWMILFEGGGIPPVCFGEHAVNKGLPGEE